VDIFDSNRKTRYYLPFALMAPTKQIGPAARQMERKAMTTGGRPETIKAGRFDAFRLARERGSLH